MFLYYLILTTLLNLATGVESEVETTQICSLSVSNIEVITAFATAITITSNGNSPDIKMKGGMMVDTQKQFVPEDMKISRTEYNKNNENLTKLSFNERYRRLIPYMTFYYANDLATPTTDNIREVEVEKAEIIETGQIGDDNQRGSKKIFYSTQNIPRYQGNRLTQHNIASANPTKLVYQEGVSAYQIPIKVITNSNPLFPDFINNDHEPGRHIQKPIHKYPNVAFVSTTRKPIFAFYNQDVPNIRYYLSEKDQAPKYKLVPYKQTPPIREQVSDNIYEVRKKPVPVPVLANKEQVYIKPRPFRPQYVYEEINIPQSVYRKPVIISDNVYEKQRPPVISQPSIENGFKPIYSSPQYIQEENIYTTNAPEKFVAQAPYSKRVQASPVISIDDLKPKYYQYVVDTTTEVSPQLIPTKLLSSIQLNKSVPKPATKGTIGSSIRTLLQALNALKAVPVNEVEVPQLSTPTPFVTPDVVQVTNKPVEDTEPASEPPQTVSDDDLHEDPYLARVNSPSQYLEDIPTLVGTRQQFPPPVTSDDEGGTPGQPGVDYPILTVIPPTSFNCKTQRYKGFFADPETRCQVWHYCDLNGGQASFLCPNGTIFSQAGLTCDWWFNVRCASTTQLYVLNESLYKYILPHKPKFPEDYSGPLVDKYLTLKFKEMEEQFKKNKNKQSASEKMDTDENESSESSNDCSENDNINKEDEETDKYKVGGNTSSEPSVIVESPGTSGNVERLHE